MLFHCDDFIRALLDIKDCYFFGFKGSGKTLGTFAVADYLLMHGRASGVWTNVDHSFPCADSVANAVVILDESSQFMDNRWSAFAYDLYSQWARKTNTIYLYPSVNAIDRRCRNLEVTRIYDYSWLPVPVWIYKWNDTLKRVGWFGLANPQEYFNSFDTEEVPTHDGGTLESIVSLYPEAVEKMLEARSGKRLARILGFNDMQSASKGMVSVASGRPVKSAVLQQQISALQEDVAQLRGIVYGLQQASGNSSGSTEASIGSYRNE